MASCPVCTARAARWWCASCVRKTIARRCAQADEFDVARAALVREIEPLLAAASAEHRASGAHDQDDADAFRLDVPTHELPPLAARVALLERLVRERTVAIEQARTRLENLRAATQSRRTSLAAAQSALVAARAGQVAAAQAAIARSKEAHAQTLHSLLRCRRLLVRDLMAVFRLRRVQRRASVPQLPLPPTPPTFQEQSASTKTNAFNPLNRSSYPDTTEAVGAAVALGGNIMRTLRAAVNIVVSETASVVPILGMQQQQTHGAQIQDGFLSTSASLTSITDDQQVPSSSIGQTRSRTSIPSSSSSSLMLPVSSSEQFEYRLFHVGFSIYGSLSTISSQHRHKLNTVVGYAMQLTMHLARYLGIDLPFDLCFAGSRSFVKQTSSPDVERKTRPLYLNDSNSEAFIAGLALLNYNIAYLCYTQGVVIPLERSVYLLENLAACCQAKHLGREFLGVRDSALTDAELFHLDLARVLQIHAACWTTGKPWELVNPPSVPETDPAVVLAGDAGFSPGLSSSGEVDLDDDAAWDLVEQP